MIGTHPLCAHLREGVARPVRVVGFVAQLTPRGKREWPKLAGSGRSADGAFGNLRTLFWTGSRAVYRRDSCSIPCSSAARETSPI